jgi:hypothetical protein
MKPLLVCGSGRTLFSDMAALGINHDSKLESFDIMAINDALLALPQAQYFTTYHTEKLEAWLILRGCRVVDGKTIPETKCLNAHCRHVSKWAKSHRFAIEGGTSALFGVQIGLKLGYARIILCGVPQDGQGRFLDPPWRLGHDYKATDGWQSWQRLHAAGGLDCVRSMSGATRDLLGSPPLEWYTPASATGAAQEMKPAAPYRLIGE